MIMDPTVCLLRALKALLNDDRDESSDSLDELSEWLVRGGFFPDVPKAVYDLMQCPIPVNKRNRLQWL